MVSDAAILSGWYYVPVGVVPSLPDLRKRLTFVPRSFDDQEPVEPIRMFDESVAGYIGVPREFGLSQFKQLPVEDRTVRGSPIRGVSKRPNPNHPRVRNPAAQAQFMQDLRAGFEKHRSFIAMAATGSGKTVCALDTAASLGCRTLVLVHLERLMFQWREEIADKLGVPESRIGLVQQDTCEWEGKDFCVGLLHSVVRRRYPDEFYRAFGLVVYDEVHKVGSQFFAPAVSLFPSRYRLGLSATPARKDGGDKVFFWHLGPIRVTSDADALPMKVYVVPHRATSNLWGSTHGARMKCLSVDPRRNELIVSFIKRFYESGRNALVVGESVAHLQKLMLLAERAGVPRASMGQFTSMRHQHALSEQTGRTVIAKSKQTKETLDKIKESAQIIFATYGMMTEGIDIPRLDAGIDATPRSAATQLIGRIRRPMPGKKMPVWITLRDIRCSVSERYFASRCKDYRSSNAEVIFYEASKAANQRTDRTTEAAVVGSVSERPTPRKVRNRQSVSRKSNQAS